MKKSITRLRLFFSPFLISLCSFLFFTSVSIAQSFESLYQEGLKMESAFIEKAALLKFREAQKIKPLDLSVLCKCSNLSGSIGGREKQTSIRDKYYETSLSFAKIACNNYPSSDEANVCMSIALGRITLIKSGKDKIELVKQIKQYADKAIKINPNNYIAWHVLGKWYYEISNLNIIEKTAIKIFFGSLPESSFANAINAFEKAKSLSKGFLQNYLELSKTYIKTDQISLARNNLAELLKLPISSEDDKITKNEANMLLKKIRLNQ